jgi:hypothetical protein
MIVSFLVLSLKVSLSSSGKQHDKKDILLFSNYVLRLDWVHLEWVDTYTHRKSLAFVPRHIDHVLGFPLPSRDFFDPTHSGEPRWEVLKHGEYVLRVILSKIQQVERFVTAGRRERTGREI